MMRKTLMMFLFGSVAVVSAMSLNVPAAQAFGDAPWCAVIELGNDDAYWDCQYRTVEECVPHILAGNRGACNVNPWPGPQSLQPAAQSNRHKRYARRHRQ